MTRIRSPPQGLGGVSDILFGTLAARPAFGTINTYYWATDIFTLFRDTGAAWEVVGASYYERYHQGVYTGILPIDLNVAMGAVYLKPIEIPRTMTVDRIIVLRAGNVNGNIRVCIYEDNGETPAGGALIVESASVAAGAALSKQEVLIADTQLTAGLYWVGLQWNAVPNSFKNDWAFGEPWGSLGHVEYAHVYGAFANPCPVIAGSSVTPQVLVRVVSIP
jgi:hypothetical protein